MLAFLRLYSLALLLLLFGRRKVRQLIIKRKDYPIQPQTKNGGEPMPSPIDIQRFVNYLTKILEDSTAPLA